MLGLLQLLAIGLLLAIAIATWATIHRLRNPPRRTYAFALARGIPGDPSELDDPRDFTQTDLPGAHGRRFPAWLIPGDEPSGPIIVCSPGWGDAKLGVLPRLPALLPHASLIVAWDPPGLGDGPGRCDLGTSSHLDLRAIAASLAESRAGPPIVLLGWSLGAGISIAAASTLDARAPAAPAVAAVIAEAPYRLPWVPARNVLRAAGLPYRVNAPLAYALMGVRFGLGPRWRGFDRAAHAAQLPCPVLLLHGDADLICPPQDARDIAAAAPTATLAMIPNAGHNNLWTDDEFTPQSTDAVGAFLSSLPS